jgi:hypothetical protein
VRLADLLTRARELAAAARPGAAGAAAWAWSHRTLVLGALVVVLALAGLRSCQRAERAEAGAAAAAARTAGEARAEAVGVPVAHQVPQAAVDEAGERAKRENPALRAQLAAAEKELGRLRLELVAHIGAAPAPAQVPVAKGQQLRLGADLVVAASPDGAHLLEGTLEARLVPGGELVLRQPYSGPVTWAVTAVPAAGCPAQQDRPWRVGGVGGVSGQGWLAGGAYARRLDLWGWQPEVLAAGAGGPGGAVLLVGALF